MARPVAPARAAADRADCRSSTSSLVLLLILTLALGSYSASAAHTIDRNFTERVYYETPADLELWEAWEYNEDEKTYYAPPFQEHYVDGVIEATPFQLVQGDPEDRPERKDGDLLALQRLDYPSVGWWRKDFAAQAARRADERARRRARRRRS